MSNPGNNPQDYELFNKFGYGDGPVSGSDKLKQESVHAWIAHPLTGSADQILPLLKSLLKQNEIQREKLFELVKLCDPTGEYGIAEAEQIAESEAGPSPLVDFWKQRVQELEEELENQKKAYAELEEEIRHLTINHD